MLACEIMASEFPSREDLANMNVKFHQIYSKELILLIYSMLDKNPIARPNISQILKNDILSMELMNLYRSQNKAQKS